MGFVRRRVCVAYLYLFERKMKRNTIIIPSLLSALLMSSVSCTGDGQKSRPQEALHAAEKIRESWTESKKSVEVEIAGRTDAELWSMKEVGLTASFRDATMSELDAFSGIPYAYGHGCFASRQPAVTADSTAVFMVSYPVHKGKTNADTLTLHAPFGENLFGKEVSRSIQDRVIKVKMQLVSSMAVLRLQIESDHLQDQLGSFTLLSDRLYTDGRYLPYSGQWLALHRGGTIRTKDISCLLNNGRPHDVYLVPSDTASNVALIAQVNNKDYALRTTLPPLRQGSLTQLNLKLVKGKLSIGSSWVETSRTFVDQTPIACDTVRVGYYLQNDGRVVSAHNAHCIAMVIETDGKHGKAIALKDEDGRHLFSGRALSSRRFFPTIDGKSPEDRLNPLKVTPLDSINKIVYKPSMPYKESCALGYAQGATLTQMLLNRMGINEPAGMLPLVQTHKGSYVPSLGELAKVYYLQQPYSKFIFSSEYKPLEGEHLSSSESSEKTFYFLDFTTGAVSGALSKRYAPMNLRLFYLF